MGQGRVITRIQYDVYFEGVVIILQEGNADMNFSRHDFRNFYDCVLIGDVLLKYKNNNAFIIVGQITREVIGTNLGNDMIIEEKNISVKIKFDEKKTHLL